MTNVRALRLHHSLTLTELALQTGIPTRTLAEIEYGLRLADADVRRRLARAFSLRTERLQPNGGVCLGGRTAQPALMLGAAALAAATVAGALMGPLARTPLAPAPVAIPRSAPLAAMQGQIASAGAALPAAAPAADVAPFGDDDLSFIAQRSAPLTPAALPTEIPTSAPAAPAPSAFTLLDDGPHGCPLLGSGPVVVTQGYGVGTHAPANAWGAVDLAVAGGSTLGAPVVATHDGVAQVAPNSWPGGNFVLIVHETTGWATAYAHLDTIAVGSGQRVVAGTQIGTAGSTGFSTGPHLHYEVRSPWGGNIDPAPLIGCR